MIDYYQVEARKTAVYPRAVSVIYPILGLQGETSEVWAKLLPNKEGKQVVVQANTLQPELGDVLWYITNTCLDADLTLLDIAEDLTGGLCPTKFADLSFCLLDSDDKRSPYVKILFGIGELSETVKKGLRGDRDDKGFDPERLRKGIGITLRAWLEICDKVHLCPDDTALANIIKLRNRAERGKLFGDGDNR